MFKSAVRSDFEELKKIYRSELLEYRRFNRRATFKLLLIALIVVIISIAWFLFGTTQRSIIPWPVISGVTGIYFIIRAIIHQINSSVASNRSNVKLDDYLKKIDQPKSMAYRVSDEIFELYIDSKLESRFRWTEFNKLIEKEGYFYLFFKGRSIILIPAYAVQARFYDALLQLAKSKSKKA